MKFMHKFGFPEKAINNWKYLTYQIQILGRTIYAFIRPINIYTNPSKICKKKATKSIVIVVRQTKVLYLIWMQITTQQKLKVNRYGFRICFISFLWIRIVDIVYVPIYMAHICFIYLDELICGSLSSYMRYFLIVTLFSFINFI